MNPLQTKISAVTVLREHKFEKTLNLSLENYSAKNNLQWLYGDDFENILSRVILKTLVENFFENSQSFYGGGPITIQLSSSSPSSVTLDLPTTSKSHAY